MNHNKIDYAKNLLFHERILEVREQLKALVLDMTQDEFEKFIGNSESIIIRTRMILDDLRKARK